MQSTAQDPQFSVGSQTVLPQVAGSKHWFRSLQCHPSGQRPQSQSVSPGGVPHWRPSAWQ